MAQNRFQHRTTGIDQIISDVCSIDPMQHSKRRLDNIGHVKNYQHIHTELGRRRAQMNVALHTKLAAAQAHYSDIETHPNVLRLTFQPTKQWWMTRFTKKCLRMLAKMFLLGEFYLAGSMHAISRSLLLLVPSYLISGWAIGTKAVVAAVAIAGPSMLAGLLYFAALSVVASAVMYLAKFPIKLVIALLNGDSVNPFNAYKWRITAKSYPKNRHMANIALGDLHQLSRLYPHQRDKINHAVDQLQRGLVDVIRFEAPDFNGARVYVVNPDVYVPHDVPASQSDTYERLMHSVLSSNRTTIVRGSNNDVTEARACHFIPVPQPPPINPSFVSHQGVYPADQSGPSAPPPSP